jgi:hypothetical protein
MPELTHSSSYDIMAAGNVEESQQSPPLLLDRLQQNVDKHNSKTSLSYIAPGLDGGRITKSCTYQWLAEETTLLAHRLLERGLKQGDR